MTCFPDISCAFHAESYRFFFCSSSRVITSFVFSICSRVENSFVHNLFWSEADILFWRILSGLLRCSMANLSSFDFLPAPNVLNILSSLNRVTLLVFRPLYDRATVCVMRHAEMMCYIETGYIATSLSMASNASFIVHECAGLHVPVTDNDDHCRRSKT